MVTVTTGGGGMNEFSDVDIGSGATFIHYFLLLGTDWYSPGFLREFHSPGGLGINLSKILM